MRPVRPTLRVLRVLPSDSYTDLADGRMIAGNQWNELNLAELKHPLLEDANERFTGGGVPDMHQAATKAAGRKVYEVRSRSGAAWRGAVVLDEAGDPWLVYVEKHDRFHSQVAGQVKPAKAPAYMPSELDYKLRKREEARESDAQWQIAILATLISVIKGAVESPKAVTKLELPLHESWSGQYFLEGSVQHDPAASTAATAHLAASSVDLWLSFSPGADPAGLHRIVQVVIPFLRVQDATVNPVFGMSGSLEIEVIFSQAKLIQIIANAGGKSNLLRGSKMPEPTHLHYVSQSYLMSAFVHGKEVRGVCGEWFVPIHADGGETLLPICQPCEEERPNAQFVLDLIRGNQT